MSYYTEVTVVGSVTVLLLVFSVVSSVYVFRGHGTNCHTKCVDCGRKGKQGSEERKGEREDNAADAITSTSTSFYASLETRPRSIYDVLDRSAANREPDRSKAKPKKKEPRKKEPRESVAQTTPEQHEGVFECVYENF
ncbi:NFAT activation molecule 1 [Clinocottus analis]|uniref:NFAT activation molecule 1 n=1 Tax=Clinocottus analis TaxID=304258 RepID=UPI0035C0F6C2